jgi:polysaccharide export outer membrane protein
MLILISVGSQLCLRESIGLTYANSNEYKIGSEDVLEIRVWGHQDLSDVVTVSENGKISLTGLPEEIHVLGLTLPQVEATLTDRFAYYLKNPKVAVTLREAKTTQITVIGSVLAPGVYPFRGKPTLIDALASAGGPAPEGDLTCVRITRVAASSSTDASTYNSMIVDVNRVLAGQGETCLLQDGDIISVPELVREVSVLGEVAHPGIYKIGDDTTLLECLAQAGGITETGDATSVQLTRRSSDRTFIAYTINLEEIHNTLDAETWIVVGGDNIYVPRP